VPAGGGSIVTDFINIADLNFGRFTNNALYFTGAMDEARIQAGVQSSNSIWASWATVAANSTLENYSAVTQQPPVLTINAGHAGGPSLTWPGSGVGFALYTTTNLAPPVVWTITTNKPVFTNNQWQINLAPDNRGSCFYRLGSQ
jgi:hypothetical protein